VNVWVGGSWEFLYSKPLKNVLRVKKTTGLHVKYLVFEVMYLSYLLVNLGPGAVFIIGFLNISHVEQCSFSLFFFLWFCLMILSVAEMCSVDDV